MDIDTLNDMAHRAAEQVIDRQARTCQEAVSAMNLEGCSFVGHSTGRQYVGERIPDQDVQSVCDEAEELYQLYLDEKSKHPERFGESY